MSKHLIDFIGISKSYDSNLVLDDLNLYIRENEFLTLLGPSGCGKTTTLRLLGGFESPDKGQILFDGQDITALAANERKLNTVFQKYSLFPHMSIAENIAFGLKISKKSKAYIRDKIKYALKLVNLEGFENRSVDSLSGGQQQRLCIARALLKKPKILILDDSTSAVDNATDAKIRRAFLTEIPNTTKLIIAQRISSVQDADRIIVLDNGELNGFGTHEELLQTNAIYRDVYESQTGGGGDFDEGGAARCHRIKKMQSRSADLAAAAVMVQDRMSKIRESFLCACFPIL